MIIYPFDYPHDPASPELGALLGGKGAGLAMMAGELGLPVPPGFTITTDACREYLRAGWSDALTDALQQGIAGIEASTGLRFGASEAPLLVSVRSGAPTSMPGMLDTILNVGLDVTSARGLAKHGEAFVAECRAGLTTAYASSLGAPPPDDAWEQLRGAVEGIFRSVGSQRAAAFRRRQGLSEEAVTAVNVQTMVFGNQDRDSATGVIFSRDPATGENRLYGDVLFRAQGDDVVSGRRQTDRVASLEARLPTVAQGLAEAVRRLELKLRDLCEVEFTIEAGRLWLLQVRVGKRSPRAALRIAAECALAADFPLDQREAVERVAHVLADPPQRVRVETTTGGKAAIPLAQGLAASPGVVSGVIAVDLAGVQAAQAAGQSVVFVRPETSPEDVEGMSLATGLLTARGGLASHAAVIARSWGTPAVVGVEVLSIDETGVGVGDRRLALGELISIDGTTGAVYAGAVQTSTTDVPEVALLREWAHALAIPIVQDGSADRSVVDEASPLQESVPATPPARDDRARPSIRAASVIGLLEIKGFALEDALAAALDVEPARLAPLLERLAAEGLVTVERAPFVGLSEAGRTKAAALLEADRASLGTEVATRALDEFQALDERMKRAVTDWQLRPLGGELVPNDHQDGRWDDGVLERLSALAEDVADWLSGLSGRLSRFERYRDRLHRALVAAQDGDGRFVASPRVDSFHGIWFELHEDLIRLARRTRAEEVAAGRAG